MVRSGTKRQSGLLFRQAFWVRCAWLNSTLRAHHSFYSHGGYGGPGWGFGVRNLLFERFDTLSSMKTWIRMEDGEVKDLLTIDSTFDP